MRDEVKDISVHHRHHEMLPVWFFSGVLLLVYGVIILFVSLREYAHPTPVVLASYHAGVWSGVVLTALGGFYTIRFRRRARKDDEERKPAKAVWRWVQPGPKPLSKPNSR